MIAAPKLREHPDDLNALVGLTSDRLGINPAFVEKDFWVTEVLRAITEPDKVTDRSGDQHHVPVIFKGGTSLSRAYGITERFSEDVDVLLGFPLAATSANERDRVLKAKCERARTHLDLPGESCLSSAQTTGVKRHVRYFYPRHVSSDAISEGVLLELGSRGGTAPARELDMMSMVAQHALGVLGDPADTWQEFAPVQVTVLAPERTLFEKLSHLHGAAILAEAGDDSALALAGRHLYDVHQLLRDRSTLAALLELGPSGVADLCRDIDERSAAAGWSVEPRPDAGYASGGLYEADSPVAQLAKPGYQRATELIWGMVPSLSACLSIVREHRTLL